MTKARNIADLGSNDVLETTATGVDVTGTVQADGLDLPNGGFLNSARNSGSLSLPILGHPSGSDTVRYLSSDGHSFVNGSLTKALQIANNGDVSFYEDTGTTAKMVWDASDEQLILGGGLAWANNVTGLQLGFNDPDGYVTTYYDNTTVTLGAGVSQKTQVKVHGQSSTEGSAVTVQTGGAERMRIDSSGNLLVGTTTKISDGISIGAGRNFSIVSDSTTSYLNMFRQAGSGSSILANGYKYSVTSNRMASSLSGAWAKSAIAAAYGSVIFYTDSVSTDAVGADITPTERARIDSSGNFRVGNTSTEISSVGGRMLADGRIIGVTNSSACFTARRLSSDGDLISFVDTIGSSLGSIKSEGSGSLSLNINGGILRLAADASVHLEVLNSASSGQPRIRPSVDNGVDIGDSGRRFDDIYATNGTIQTSDRNEKQDIETLSDAEQRVAQACKGLLRKFRWKDSVAEKGDDARIHFGIIAQDLQDAFTAEGLDAKRYAMFISSTWTDEETGEERTRLGVRYPELLAFIISAL